MVPFFMLSLGTTSKYLHIMSFSVRKMKRWRMFSILFNKDKNSSTLKGAPRKDKSLYSKVVLFFLNIFCKSKEEKRAEEDAFLELYNFRSVASCLCEIIVDARKKNAQGLSEDFCMLVKRININALNGLMINKPFFQTLAEMNSIYCLSDINQDYYHPCFAIQKTYNSNAYVFNPSTSLPEYIFSGDFLKPFWGDPDSSYCPKIIVFQRVILEIFMGSSILAQEYSKSGVINKALFERLVLSGKELEFLLNKTLSVRDFLNFEMERENSLLGVSYEEVERLIVPYRPFSEAKLEFVDVSEGSQQNKEPLNAKRGIDSTEKCLEIEAVELLDESEYLIENANANADVILYLSKLEEDHHRRDIYFAIIAYDFVREGNVLTFKFLWKWLIKNLAENPLQTRNIDGYEVKVFSSGGVIEHLGLLKDSKKKSQIKKETFRRVYYKKIKPIIPKIKGFCIEKNIKNIPIIP